MNRREILQGSTALAVAAAAGIKPAAAQGPIVIKFSHVVATDAPKGKASEKFRELVRKFANSDLARRMFDKLEANGVKGLAYWDNGFHVMAANKAIHNVKDFQGLKLRIQGSKVLNATTKAWGAIPQVMAFSEVYQALQTGVVDGLENVPSNIWTQKFYEVVKYIAVSHHGHLSYAVVTNKKFWDGLPADLRPPLEKAMAEASDYFNAIAKTRSEEALEEIRKSGKVQVYPLTPDERKSWLQAVLPVHKEMEKRIGKDVIDALYKVVDFRPDA